MELHSYVRFAIVTLIAVVVLFVGWRFFSYYSYSGEPMVKVVGLEQGGCYKGSVRCSLAGSSGYKIAYVNVLLDGKSFVVPGAQSICSKSFELPFDINTIELADGKHVMQLEAVDGSRHANKKIEQLEFFVDNLPLKVAVTQPDYRVDQGHTLHPKIQINKQIASATIDFISHRYECYPDGDNSTVYECFIPLECEQNPGEFVATLEVKDKVGNGATATFVVHVDKIILPSQKGFKVTGEKLDNEKEVSMNNRILAEALDKWVVNSPKKKLWTGPFEFPTVVKKITTPYGEVRVTPEKGRYIHKAIDIANYPKSVVWASQNGKVIIKDRYLMTGNTVVIDHGLGVFTKYFHLDSFADIEIGNLIKKGEPVGKVGMTGYSNGYHLHWELSVNGVSVDPIEWTKKIF